MKQRRKKQKKQPKSFSIINPDAAGIDIGSAEHWVAVPADRGQHPVRKFKCFTADLHNMADWLNKCGIKTIAMESTGVYWIPAFQILESRGFEVKLVNAKHVKNVPGRKAALFWTAVRLVSPREFNLRPSKLLAASG